SFFASRRRHTRFSRDWSSDVCSSDLVHGGLWAVKELGIPVCLVGARPRLEALLAGQRLPDGLSIEHAPEAVAMDEAGAEAVRRRSEERRGVERVAAEVIGVHLDESMA